MELCCGPSFIHFEHFYVLYHYFTLGSALKSGTSLDGLVFDTVFIIIIIIIIA